MLLFMAWLFTGLFVACSVRSDIDVNPDVYDFMIFTDYHGEHGISGVLQQAVDRLKAKEYQGSFIRSNNADMERSFMYEILSRQQVDVIFSLPKSFFSF